MQSFEPLPNRISQLKNLGPKSEEMLPQVGVHTPQDLGQLGAVEVYLRLKERFPKRINLLALYALEGALLDIHWNELPVEVKEQLREQVERRV